MTWFLIKLELYEEWEIKLERVHHISTIGKYYCLTDSRILFAYLCCVQWGIAFWKYFYNFRYRMYVSYKYWILKITLIQSGSCYGRTSCGFHFLYSYMYVWIFANSWYQIFTMRRKKVFIFHILFNLFFLYYFFVFLL